MGLYNYETSPKPPETMPQAFARSTCASLYFDTIQKPSAHSTAGQSVTISSTHTLHRAKGVDSGPGKRSSEKQEHG